MARARTTNDENENDKNECRGEAEHDEYERLRGEYVPWREWTNDSVVRTNAIRTNDMARRGRTTRMRITKAMSATGTNDAARASTMVRRNEQNVNGSGAIKCTTERRKWFGSKAGAHNLFKF